MRRQRDLGCIDPHGMWPFPADRESCPKCQAIRTRQSRIRRGLPYGWWKNPDIWAFTIMVFMIAGLGLGLFMGWFW